VINHNNTKKIERGSFDDEEVKRSGMWFPKNDIIIYFSILD